MIQKFLGVGNFITEFYSFSCISEIVDIENLVLGHNCPLPILRLSNLSQRLYIYITLLSKTQTVSHLGLKIKLLSQRN